MKDWLKRFWNKYDRMKEPDRLVYFLAFSIFCMVIIPTLIRHFLRWEIEYGQMVGVAVMAVAAVIKIWSTR